MNLLYDLSVTQPNISGRRHGGGKYAEIIFFRMIDLKIRFFCFYDSTKWINPTILNACAFSNIPISDLKEETISQIVKKYKIDRLYSALPGKTLKNLNCEVYGTIHGLRELETPFDKYFFLYRTSILNRLKFCTKVILGNKYLKFKHKFYLNNILNSLSRFITVSEHSKYALRSFFPELKEKEIKVFYSPNTSYFPEQPRIKKQKYYLLVSGNRWEKNNLRAIMAFDKLFSQHQLDSNVRVKVAGASLSDFSYKIRNRNLFDFLGYVEDLELEKLYANAYLLIYPTLNEGFGYPPLEAMRYKVPVISSPFTSIPEVCSDCVLYFNPFSIEEMMGRILMMEDPSIYNTYAKKGYKRYLEIKQRQDADLDYLIDFLIK